MFEIFKKSGKSSLKRKKFGSFFYNFWNNHFGLFFVAFSIILVSLGSYVWYRNIYLDRWDSEEKNKYKIGKNEEVEFKEQLFQNVLDMSEKKKKLYEEKTEEVRDIFSSYIKIENEELKQEEEISEAGTTNSTDSIEPTKTTEKTGENVNL